MRIWILGSLLASVASASTINSLSLATDLIGGTVTVTSVGGVMSSATFVAAVGGSRHRQFAGIGGLRSNRQCGGIRLEAFGRLPIRTPP